MCEVLGSIPNTEKGRKGEREGREGGRKEGRKEGKKERKGKRGKGERVGEGERKKGLNLLAFNWAKND
jgi:hypothetical protein